MRSLTGTRRGVPIGALAVHVAHGIASPSMLERLALVAVVLVGCGGPSPASPPVSTSAPAQATREPNPSNVSDASGCTFNFNSIPSTVVTLDGRTLGTTPQLGVSATPGSHAIVFTDSDNKKATSVACRAGETKTIAVRMTPLAQ
jgi:hypothetical protein